MRSPQRFSRFEILERRQLFAAELESCFPEATDESLPMSEVAAPLDVVNFDFTLPNDSAAPFVFGDTFPDIVYSRGPSFERYDFLQQHGSRIYAIDRDDYSDRTALFVFEQKESGELAKIAEVPLNLFVQRMIVEGDQVLLLGSAYPRYYIAGSQPIVAPEHPDDQTVALTINLVADSDPVVTEQSFPDEFRDAHYEDGRLTLVTYPTNLAVPLIYPPPPIPLTVTTLDWTTAGLVETAKNDAVHFERFFIQDDTLYGIENRLQYFGNVEIEADDEELDGEFGYEAAITHYELGSDAILRGPTLVLGRGYVTEFTVAEDGLSAAVVRVDYAGDETVTTVDRLDLSDETIQLIESIELENVSGYAVLTDPDFVVLQSEAIDGVGHELIVVSTKTVESEGSRVRRIALPAIANDYTGAVRIGDTLVISLPASIEFNDENEVTFGALRSASVVTIDLTTGTLISETPLEGGNQVSQFFLIDETTKRIGFETYNPAAFTLGRSFEFGHLDDDGVYVKDRQLPFVLWQDFDVTSEQLVAQTSDQVIRFSWNDFENPIATPMGEPDPVTVAQDDHYVFANDGESHLLDVLANDRLLQGFHDSEIESISGAPEGTRIVDGRFIKIPASALEGVDRRTFQYTVASGGTTSTATVTVDVLAVTNVQVDALVQLVVARAAEDFDVSIDDISVLDVTTLYLQTIPAIRVTVVSADLLGEYTVTLDGQIENDQTQRSERQVLVDLALRAVDEDGNVITEIRSGDFFWIEFTAKDLRTDGGGVFAAFLDLVLPSESIAIAGRPEFGDDFDRVGREDHFDITDSAINDLGAISSVVANPGNALQVLIRVPVVARSAGQVRLTPEPADGLGTETLIRGDDDSLQLDSVRYQSLRLSVLPQLDLDTLDSDADGEVKAGDALKVINFLGRFGSMKLEDLPARVTQLLKDHASGIQSQGTVAEGESVGRLNINLMRRLDANGSGTITALDALVIINRLSRISASTEVPIDEDDM